MNASYQYSSYGNSNRNTYLEQKTLSASPLELVTMLYSKAISEIREARKHLTARNVQLRSDAIAKACDVIGELDASLNMDAGGELSQRLRSLYRYCLVRLLDANLRQSDEPLGEVLGLLITISEGWQAASENTAKLEAALPRTTVGAWQGSGPASGMADLEGETIGQSHSWTL